MNVETMMIKSGDTLPIQMNPGGGFVAHFSTNTADMKWWRDGRFGMFIHWGPVSIKGTEIGWSRGKQIPVEQYDQLYKEFNPEEFNAAEWVSLAKEAGMKYIVITAKHHDGFCLWDSEYTDYDIMSTPFGRDILKELSDECKKQEIKFCVYYSILDWYQPDYNTTDNQGGPGYKLPAGQKPDMNRYVTYMKNQLKEIIENYGPVGILWFDGEWERQWTHERGIDLYNYVRNLQPDIIINNRVGKGREGMKGTTKSDEFAGDYDTPEQRIGEFQTDRPWETCMTIGKQWAYKPDDKLKSAKECIRTLVRTAGGDGNLLLNVGPMPDGTIEPGQADVLRQMGEWLKYNKFTIYKTRGGPFMPGTWGASTYSRTAIFLHVFDWGGNTINITPLRYKMRDITVQKPIHFRYKYDWTDEKHLEIVLAEKYHDDIDTVIILSPNGPPFPIITTILLLLINHGSRGRVTGK